MSDVTLFRKVEKLMKASIIIYSRILFKFLGVTPYRFALWGQAFRYSGFAFEGFFPEFIREKTLWKPGFEKPGFHNSNP